MHDTHHEAHDPDDWSAWQRRAHHRHASERRAILGKLRESWPPHQTWSVGDRVPRAVKVTQKMASCCRHPSVWSNGERVHVAKGRCKHRLCPLCAELRSKCLNATIMGVLPDAERIRFITLTVPNPKDAGGQSLRAQVDHLRASFARLRRIKEWKRKVDGGVAVLETKWTDAGRWHPHLHVLFWGDYWEQRRLAACWSRACPRAEIVDIRSAGTTGRAARYVSKYVAKACQIDKMPPERLNEWVSDLHGVRFVSTFGEAHGVVRESPGTKEKDPSEAPMEHVGGLACVAEWAEFGHVRSRRVLRCVLLAATFKDENDERRRRRSAAAVRMLRAWWRGFHDSRGRPASVAGGWHIEMKPRPPARDSQTAWPWLDAGGRSFSADGAVTRR